MFFLRPQHVPDSLYNIILHSCAFSIDYRSVEPTENLGLTVGYKGPYFHDGQRSIDMVLVFQCKQTQHDVKDRKSRDIRKRFINELITNGLQIEIERIQHLVRDFYFAIELN